MWLGLRTTGQMLGSPELFCHAESPSQGAWLGLRLRPCPSSAVFLLGHGGRAGQHSHAPTSLPPLGRFVAPAGWLSPTGPVLTHGHPLPCWPHPHSTRSPHVSVTWECDAGAAPSPTFLAILMCPQGGESRVASAKRFAPFTAALPQENFPPILHTGQQRLGEMKQLAWGQVYLDSETRGLYSSGL